MTEKGQQYALGDATRDGSIRRNRSFAFEDGQVAVLSTMSAAFSPIMMDGALVLPESAVRDNFRRHCFSRARIGHVFARRRLPASLARISRKRQGPGVKDG